MTTFWSEFPSFMAFLQIMGESLITDTFEISCFRKMFVILSNIECSIQGETPRDGHALLDWPSRIPHRNQKTVFVLGADECIERLEGKIRECLFFYVNIF